MNLWDKKLGLLVLVALSFFACEEEIGTTNVTPENNLGIFFAEYPLEGNVNQLWAGSSPSSFSGRAMVGVTQDSIFGEIKSVPYFDYLLRSFKYDTLSIETAELYSVELEFRISSLFGDFKNTDIQSFEIYSTSLIDDYDSKTSASSELIFDKIGEAEFTVNKDSLNLNSSIYNGDTSLYDVSDFDGNGNYIYKKSFKLSQEYLNDLNDKFKSGIVRGRKDPNDKLDIDSTFYFVRDELDQGFAIIPKESNTAVILFNVANTDNYNFSLKYKVTNAVGTEIKSDDLAITFALNAYNSITPNELIAWSGGKFNGINSINSTITNANEYLHYQSGTNMLIEIDLAEFDNIEDTIPNAIIQKAVLSINNPIEFSNSYPIPSSIGVYLTNEDLKSNGELNNLIEINVLKDLPSNAILDTANNVYNIEIPLYLQSLADRKISYNKLVLGLDNTTSDTKVGNDEVFSAFSVKKDDIKITYYYSVTK